MQGVIVIGYLSLEVGDWAVFGWFLCSCMQLCAIVCSARGRKRKTTQAVKTTPTLIKEKEQLWYRVP